jgi:hypothetical protein
VSSGVVRGDLRYYLVYLLAFYAYFYWGFYFLKGSLRHVFISRSALKDELLYNCMDVNAHFCRAAVLLCLKLILVSCNVLIFRMVLECRCQ